MRLHTLILLGDAPPGVKGDEVKASPAGLVGRAAELAALQELLGRARAGESVLMLVEGEAGIGKTALVSRWSQGLVGEALVISGRCAELGRDLPLQPTLDGLEAHVRTVDPSDIQAVLADAEPVHGPLLGRFNAGATESGPTTVADPAAGRALLFARLAGDDRGRC